MADSITFRGAFIRYFDVRQEEGGAFTRLHLTAEFSTPVIEAMDWADPGNSISSANLDGELCATHFLLTPGQKCTRNELVEAAATLATAREANGGTHARKRKDLQ